MAAGNPTSGRLGNAGTYVFLAVVSAFMLVPIYWIVATSFKPTSEILVTPTTLLTTHPTLDHYRTALAGDFRRYLVNSLIAAGGSTALGFVLSVPAAWGFAKFAYPGSSALLSFTVVTRVFPPIALALPFFLQFRAFGLIDNPLGLIIAYLPIVLPLMIWILTGFFRDFPDELVEAARMDGLGTPGILVRIVMPLSLPGLGVAALFGFLVAWNEFVIALTITRTPAAQTMPVGISTLITQFQTLWGEMMAVAAIYLLPVLAVTVATQRGLVRGLMAGSTKG
ncbi:carbohydrate ABC transporter permease [Mesorhizobium sp. CN2-181]|uniref:carbohydrate ABC transporter permease n=1 Tax=Mesorhizobium yinganensis TaxID=3157707 RepID=UPI0032B80ED0